MTLSGQEENGSDEKAKDGRPTAFGELDFSGGNKVSVLVRG